MIVLYIFLAGVSLVKGSTDVCIDHMTLPNIHSRYINFRIDSTDTPFHDYHLTEGWYYVGNVTMPEHPPDDIFTCGTKFPVWLNGKHPTGDSAVTVQACQLTVIEDCKVKYDINIRKCKGFYVYYLRPTGSANVGYCFGEGKTGPAPKYVSPKPEVRTDVMINAGRGGRVVSSTYFACDFIESKSESLFYVVSWYMNGNMLHMTPYKNNVSDPLLRLTEELFSSCGFELGNNVSCSVRAFHEKDSAPGKSSTMSMNFFAGIKVLTPDISFSRDEKVVSKRSIRLKPTIPIGCQGEKCGVDLVAYVPNNYAQCTGLAFHESSCGIKLQSESFNATRDIFITTEDTGQYSAKIDVYEIFLKTVHTDENMIWSNYSLPPIKVSITVSSKNKIYEGKRCSSYNDPHITTFDGRVYDNHQEGDYILYRNTKYNTEVQAKYTTCGSRGSNMPIKCNCGIAVRAGQDMFEINVCEKQVFIGYHYCDDNILQVKSDGNLKYKIFFAYGTYVQTTIDKRYKQLVFNTEIIPSSHDQYSTVGLCGTLDNDASNDFHRKPDRNGTITAIHYYPVNIRVHDWSMEYKDQPKDFIKEWRVNSESENLFSTKYNRKNFIPWTLKTCVCTNFTMSTLKGGDKVEEKIPCKTSGVASCTKGRIVGTHSCSFEHSRRRRSLKRSSKVPIVYIADQTRHKRDVTITNMTASDARRFCQDHIGASEVFALCSTVPNVHPNSSLETCIGDIMLTGTTVWTDATKESMQDACLTELRRNTTLREKQGNKTSIAEKIENIACPNNCSASGDCIKGECACDGGFGGSDCSIDLSRGPTISGLLDHGLCDEKELECDHAYVFGSVFTDSENLTCKLEEFTISENGTRHKLQVHYIPAEFETLVETMCPLTQTRRKRSVTDTDVFVRGYKISVSNDGNTYEDGKDLFMYDSTCQIAQNSSNSLHFVLKDGFCFINNKCVPKGGLNLKDKCLKCNDAVTTKSWTNSHGPGCSKTQNRTPDQTLEQTPVKTDDSGSTSYLWVIGVVAGVLVGIAVGVIVVIKLTTKRGRKVSDSTLLERQVTSSKTKLKGSEN